MLIWWKAGRFWAELQHEDARLTFSHVDGRGLVGGACVCVAFVMPPTASGTGVRELSVNTPSFLVTASAAVSTARRRRRQEGVRRCSCTET